MTFQVNIANLIQEAFGIKGYVPVLAEDSVDLEFNVPQLALGSEPFVTSILGTPIYEVITWKHQDLEDYTMLDHPLVDISRAKNIVKTSVAGRDGTFKEFISHDDYKVRIRGLIINYDNQDYPAYQKIQSLNQLCELKTPIEVEAKLLNAIGIYNLVIQNVSFPRLEGKPGTQPYILDCLSDKPFELELRDSI